MVDFRGIPQSLLSPLLQSAGVGFRQHDNVLEAVPSESAVQAVIDAYTVADAVASLVPQIKEHAREIILARYPEWRQANMTARAAELIEAQQSAPLSAPDAAELVALKSAWAWIKSVRMASNAHEAAIAQSATHADVAAYDWHVGWPD